MINKNKKVECHTYKVVQTLDSLGSEEVYPTVNMEINEQASLSDHLHAFERFLWGIGFTLPENSHLEFIQDELESRDMHIEDMTIIEGQANNGVN